MSYASDLRAAAEAERTAREAVRVGGSALLLARHRAVLARVDLTIPDRLLPFLAYVEQLERVAEAAKAVRHDQRELTVDEWEVLWNDFFDALDALDREAR